jgi:hypothetical protein
VPLLEYFARVGEENTLRIRAGEAHRDAILESQVIDGLGVVISRRKR